MRRWWHRPLAASGAMASMIGCSQPAPTAHRGREADHSVAPRAEEAESGAEAAGAGPAATSAGVETAAVARPPESSTPADPTTSTTVTMTVPTTPRRTTTTFTLPEAETEETDEEWWEAQPGYVPPARAVLLACIRSYEENDDPKKGPVGYASDTGNGYFGAYQFNLGTWLSVGGSGNPAHASPAEQDERAWQLYLSRGLAPWPTPARRCG
jgi:hypothetical protein